MTILASHEARMRFGIHLPQVGLEVTPSMLMSSAALAEDLGFSDVWVSDHVVVPSGSTYPVAGHLDPIVSLTLAATTTARVGLGTSVLVLPYRNPIIVAKQLATLDLASHGRLILGVGTGWLRAEFEALSVPFGRRGALLDGALAVLSACWGPQPIEFQAAAVRLSGVRVEPTPGRSIPIWIGGTSSRALTRAALHDGWHGTFLSPSETDQLVRQLNSLTSRPLAISMRIPWDGSLPVAKALALLSEYSAVGVNHIVFSPHNAADGGRGHVEVNEEIWSQAAERLAQLMRKFHQRQGLGASPGPLVDIRPDVSPSLRFGDHGDHMEEG